MDTAVAMSRPTTDELLREKARLQEVVRQKLIVLQILGSDLAKAQERLRRIDLTLTVLEEVHTLI